MNRTTESSSKKKKYTLPPNDTRAGYVKENFNDISVHYDTFNDAITLGFHRLWKKQTILATGIQNSKKFFLVDLCSGTGDLAIQAARFAPEGARILAMDFSPGMLQVLQERLKTREDLQKQIQVQEGDATDLSFLDDQSVDGITIGFGLRNVNDRSKTLSEALRVLKPGGVFAILDVGQVRIPVIRQIHDFIFESIVPSIGSLLQGKKHEMYQYLPASAKEYPDQETLKRELLDAGFFTVQYRNFFLGSAALHIATKQGIGNQG